MWRCSMIPKRTIATRWSHWLVYPPRSATHQGFLAFREWLHAEAAEHALHMNTAG